MMIQIFGKTLLTMIVLCFGLIFAMILLLIGLRFILMLPEIVFVGIFIYVGYKIYKYIEQEEKKEKENDRNIRMD